ncbi:TSC complex subunit 1a isoform X2 [Genypterus blacodes]|uniref:TSC complex subunit 1a isoform X2 n=1 Tax=Genypterus blacodes TaxID=154954 RepID=UPI003F765B8B
MMAREQVSISELLLSLDSSELQEAEQVRVAVNQQLSTDRGGAVLSSLVDYYLDSSSSQAVVLLSSVRESHHKPLLEKLNEALGRSGSRLASLTLLGHLIRKQPPWVHHISRSALLQTLLRSLKTDTDAVVLITGVLVLITLLPMIPQAGKQHIYDFFDVFGRLSSWSLRNPGHVPAVHLVHLHASVYSLFHRLYGMYPCNFISYLRLHYSMKENLDTFHELVKPMLDHVRVHPELVTGTQDQELDPSRWRCFEVHDIVIECSRVSLDPLDSSCEEDVYSSLWDSSSCSSSPRPPSFPQLDVSFSPQTDFNGTVYPPVTAYPAVTLPLLTVHSSDIQVYDVTWSPSSDCGLSTPPPEPSATGSAHPLIRAASVSGVRGPVSVTTATTEGNNNNHQQPIAALDASAFQPITKKEEGALNDIIAKREESERPSSSSSSSLPPPLTSTPRCADVLSVCFTPRRPLTSPRLDEEDPAQPEQSPAPPYEPLFELALPRAASLFVGKKTQEVLERGSAELEQRGGAGGEEELSSVSPLEVLDQLITQGDDVHKHLSQRLPGLNKSLDRSHCGGKQQSMKTKGPTQGEELQTLRSQLLLVHSQLQYERFKRQQHAIRNRRLLRRVINATALKEHSVAMRAQLSVQDVEIQALKRSLEEEQRRYTQLHHDTHTSSTKQNTHIQQLLLQQEEGLSKSQRLQNELRECQGRQRYLEVELQRANNEAYNAEHQLTQLSIKVSLSQQVQQQFFLLNQQLLLLRETNRALTEQLEGEQTHKSTEVSMLQCTVGKEYLRLMDSELQHRQKLDAANHRISELENESARKDQLILDQKKLLEETKSQSRAELGACEGRCASLRRITQALQAEMLQLHGVIDLETHRPEDTCGRRNSCSVAMPSSSRSLSNKPLSSSFAMLNGGVETFSTSPLLLPSCSSSPLAVGSFLEQRARQLFGPLPPSQDSEEEPEEEPEEEEEQPGSPAIGQEVDEEALLTGSPESSGQQEVEPASQPSDSEPEPPRGPAWVPPLGPTHGAGSLIQAVRQRRHELSIMDYDETLPEF